MILLLILNITRTYDKMIHRYLIHILRVKRILKNMINWVYSFIIDRTITLMIKNYKTKKILINAEISQNSLLSLILYLFYAVELLEICNNTSERLNVNEFINDINLF